MNAHKISKKRCIGLAHVTEYPSSFFYGASANMIGGAGVHLMISQDHFFSVKMGWGLRNNTRYELLALWAMLVISKDLGLPSLHVCGDSIAIINWVNSKGNSHCSQS